MGLADVDIKQVARYCATDAILPIHIINRLEKNLRVRGEYSPQLVALFSYVTPFVANIQSAGFAFDLPKAEEARRELESLRQGAQDNIYEYSGEINLNSPKQKAWFLFGDKSGVEDTGLPTLGMDIPKIKGARTDTGQASTGINVREALRNIHPAIDSLNLWSRYDKALDYLDICSRSVGDGSLIRGNFKLVRIVSGRLAVSDPPLQLISAKKFPQLKRLFVSRWGHGGVILSLDGGQMELRWGAMESNCTAIIEAIKAGIHPHQATADMCNVDYDLGKRINFACVYGASWQKLEQLGVQRKIAKEVVKKLEREWAPLYKFQEEVKYEILNTGKTSTTYGRVRRLPKANSFYDHEVLSGVNFRFQAPASDLTQLLGSAIVRSCGELALPIMTNHDGLDFDLRKDDLPIVLRHIEKCVKDLPGLAQDVLGISLTIPFEFTIKTGVNWLDQKEIVRYTT
jgi:DNA polymerase I-like protein with 3'-5' exonuclease and polymerase domains